MVHDLILAARARFDHEGGDPPSPVPLPGDLARAIVLPPAITPHPRSLRSVITSRRSTSLRGSDPLPLSHLAFLLRSADFPGSAPLCSEPGLRVQLFVVALDVPPLEPAVYRYDQDHRLLPVAKLERERIREEVLLQHDQGDAAALLFVVTPLAQWLRTHGDRGYRTAMLSVGWVIDSLYLRAEQLRLYYSATGGFALARANELLHLDGYEQTAALAFAVGTDPSATVES